MRINLTDHKEKECCLRLVFCKHCPWIETSQELNDHYLSCKDYPVPCPNSCAIDNISSQNVEGHLQECPEQQVVCPYSDIGCRNLSKRNLLDSHVEASKDIHFKLSLDRVCELTRIIMERSLDTSNMLSLTIHPWLRNTKLFPSMPWIIRLDDFAKKKVVGVKWTSDPFFTTTGYKLCLQIYPGGDSEEDENYISLFSTLQRGPNNDILSWPFDKIVNITLLNQLEDRFHYTSTSDFGNADEDCTRVEPEEQSATGWGESEFIPHTDLNKSQSRNCQYLKDDCLFFKIGLQ